MNFINMIIKKPLSFGAIVFFWMPFLGGCSLIAFYGLKYWYLSLGMYIIVCMMAGTQRGRRETKAQRLESEYSGAQMERNARKIDLLYQIGSPQKNGRYNDAQMKLWEQYNHLDEVDKEQTAKERHHLVETRGGYIE